MLDEPRRLLRTDHALILLRFLRFHSLARLSPTLEQLETFLSRKQRMSRIEVRRHLAWLLKYDLVRVAKK